MHRLLSLRLRCFPIALSTLAVFISLVGTVPPVVRAAPQTFFITTIADSDAGSLRQAILDANANPGLDYLFFNIPGGGVHTIAPLSALPQITSPVILDGYTQPGAAKATANTPATLRIELNGLLAGVSVDGLHITAGYSTVRGLSINRFTGSGIRLASGDVNTIEGNHIGTNAAGSAALANGGSGIHITSNSFANRIGTNGDNVDDAAERNVISGNTQDGIWIDGGGAFGNVVAGNYIGINAAGSGAVPNGVFAVTIANSPQNRIGTNGDAVADVAERNLIVGTVLIQGMDAAFNSVAGNYIGVDATGTTWLGASAVRLQNTAYNRVGTNGDGLGDGAERNVIGGNIEIYSDQPTSAVGNNIVAGNYVGVNAAGTALLGAPSSFVNVFSSAQNRIGTNGDGVGDAAERNVIAGVNGYIGLSGSSNIVAGNYVGVNAAGTGVLGAASCAVIINAATQYNRVGTDGNGLADGAERNVIAGYVDQGVCLTNTDTPGQHLVAGNYIGLNAAGTAPLESGTTGIYVGSPSNALGGTAPSMGNVITNADSDGVLVNSGLSATLLGNRIFANGGKGINGSQFAAPTLTDAVSMGSSLVFSGALASTPNTTFRIELFSNSACDTLGAGEGENYLGFYDLPIDSGGSATFNTTLPVYVPGGRVITATATGPGGTSEFSFCRTVAAPVDTIGVFRPSTATFYLRTSNTTGPANLTTPFGLGSDLPLVGDWNGDGVDTVGVYRPGTAQFFLRDSNAPGAPVAYSFTLGNPGDVPFAGDWDGDGKDGVGVFRPTNGRTFLKNALSTGFADFQMVYGVAGDQPVGGDWDGDGKDSPGVYRTTQARFFLTNQVCNCTPTTHHSFTLGNPGDVPFAGDWNGDGKSSGGVFRPSNGRIFLRNALTTGSADVQIIFGIANDRPVAGHWTSSLNAPYAPASAPKFEPPSP